MALLPAISRAEVIQAGSFSMSFGADGKLLSLMRGEQNLVNAVDPGEGFVLKFGKGAGAQHSIPLNRIEIKNGTMIVSADGKLPRVTMNVKAGRNHVAFRIERVEGVPAKVNPEFCFSAKLKTSSVETIALDYMTVSGGGWASIRQLVQVSWPYLWNRNPSDPLGGFALFVADNDEQFNETLLDIWVTEKLPHPKVEGEWTLERARQWVVEWHKAFPRQDQLTIAAKAPQDLDVLFEFAKKLQVNRIYMHTDTWRGEYWPHQKEALHVNPAVFPNGEADLKAFTQKLKGANMEAMLHDVCYGFGEGSKYVGSKPDRRLAAWGRGTLEVAVDRDAKTLLFRPDPGVEFPLFRDGSSEPGVYPDFWKMPEVLIGDEIVQVGAFSNTDKLVWTLEKCSRGMFGTQAANHVSGTPVAGLLKAYNQNYYPDSSTDLVEETARDLSQFLTRNGVNHHEHDGAECHNDVPWGYLKWAMHVYSNTERPSTSNNSSAVPNPWDLVYKLKSGGRPFQSQIGGGDAALFLHEDRRLATNPIENHFTLARGAAANGVRFIFGKPEPMFGISAAAIDAHGLSSLFAEQFALWREVAGKLSPEQRKLINATYSHDGDPKNPNRTNHKKGAIVYEARKTGDGFEILPFTILRRAQKDIEWFTVQEFGVVMPRQYVLPGESIRLDNPFGRQAPEFIIRVMNGFAEGLSESPKAAEVVNTDLQNYLVGAGIPKEQSAPADSKAPSQPASSLIMPAGAQISSVPGFELTETDGSLVLSAENPRGTEFLKIDGFPAYRVKSDSRGARGLAFTVEGDGSGALLVFQLSGDKDYVLSLDFKGPRDIVIPSAAACWADARWGFRYTTKRAKPDVIRGVAVGFGRIPPTTKASAVIKNLRLLREVPAVLKDPVIHAGAGTLSIKGACPSECYLWYRGGDTVGVYDANWKPISTLPVVAENYAVETGASDFRIENRGENPKPWLDVQFITKGQPLPIESQKPE